MNVFHIVIIFISVLFIVYMLVDIIFNHKVHQEKKDVIKSIDNPKKIVGKCLEIENDLKSPSHIFKPIYGDWFNVDQFLSLKEDFTFTWKMTNFLGKGIFDISVVVSDKIKLEFFFENGEYRIWDVHNLKTDILEIQSQTIYHGKPIKFILYKNRNLLER